ncbi:MAG TPA: hypothetical protein VFP77_10060, partial [Gemmatimonadaceae bacterium]|nr:hypothetical protein [Gemmatimonadaceae bacterium]
KGSTFTLSLPRAPRMDPADRPVATLSDRPLPLPTEKEESTNQDPPKPTDEDGEQHAAVSEATEKAPA